MEKKQTLLKELYPDIFDPERRAFGLLAQELWHNYVDPQYHADVDELIAELNAPSVKGQANSNTSVAKHFTA